MFMIKNNKIKKALFTAAVTSMSIVGGAGLTKHHAKAEKEQLKAKVETSFDTQIKLNNNQLAEITAERDSLHYEARHIVESMIYDQNDMASKQLKSFYSKAKKSFTKTEIEQLKEEWRICSGGEEYLFLGDDLVNWAINIDGNRNMAHNFRPHAEGDLTDAPIKYKALGAKRTALKKEFEAIRFVYDDSKEEDFVRSMITYTDNKDADFYSVIIDDIVNYYNSKEVKVDCWDEYYNMPTTRVCYISKEDIAGGVPDFRLVVFKKYKSKIDTICKRLHELDKQEKQLQQARNLKKTIMADFPR